MQLSKKILEILKRSPTSKPISNAQIRSMLEANDGIFVNERTVRNEITNLRLCEAVAICANSKGYFLPNNPSHLSESILRIQRQIATLKATSKVLSDRLYLDYKLIPVLSDDKIELIDPKDVTPPAYDRKLEMFEPELIEQFFAHIDNEN